MRLPDFAVLLLAAAITVFCAAGVYGKSGSALRLIIQGKQESWVYPINQTVREEIPGLLGNTVVELQEGRARVVSSPCANQLCVSAGAIHRRGQWIACLPNGIFVRVEATGASVDAGAGASTGAGENQQGEFDAAVW